MSDLDTLAATVRDGLLTGKRAIAKGVLPGYRADYFDPSVAALAALVEHARTLERERGEAIAANEAAKQFSYASHRRRAEAAEARADRYEKALQKILTSDSCDTRRSGWSVVIARAALAREDA
jgi:hypothetical protein